MEPDYFDWLERCAELEADRPLPVRPGYDEFLRLDVDALPADAIAKLGVYEDAEEEDDQGIAGPARCLVVAALGDYFTCEEAARRDAARPSAQRAQLGRLVRAFEEGLATLEKLRAVADEFDWLSEELYASTWQSVLGEAIPSQRDPDDLAGAAQVLRDAASLVVEHREWDRVGQVHGSAVAALSKLPSDPGGKPPRTAVEHMIGELSAVYTLFWGATLWDSPELVLSDEDADDASDRPPAQTAAFSEFSSDWQRRLRAAWKRRMGSDRREFIASAAEFAGIEISDDALQKTVPSCVRQPPENLRAAATRRDRWTRIAEDRAESPPRHLADYATIVVLGATYVRSGNTPRSGSR